MFRREWRLECWKIAREKSLRIRMGEIVSREEIRWRQRSNVVWWEKGMATLNSFTKFQMGEREEESYWKTGGEGMVVVDIVGFYAYLYSTSGRSCSGFWRDELELNLWKSSEVAGKAFWGGGGGGSWCGNISLLSRINCWDMMSLSCYIFRGDDIF